MVSQGIIKSFLCNLIIIISSLQMAYADTMSSGISCKNAQSTIQMNRCGARALNILNRKMEEQYNKVLSELKSKKFHKEYAHPDVTKGIISNLLMSQKDWFFYRREYCRSIYYLNIEGSDRLIMKIGCELSITKHRINELKKFFP